MFASRCSRLAVVPSHIRQTLPTCMLANICHAASENLCRVACSREYPLGKLAVHCTIEGQIPRLAFALQERRCSNLAARIWLCSVDFPSTLNSSSQPQVQFTAASKERLRHWKVFSGFRAVSPRSLGPSALGTLHAH